MIMEVLYVLSSLLELLNLVLELGFLVWLLCLENDENKNWNVTNKKQIKHLIISNLLLHNAVLY